MTLFWAALVSVATTLVVEWIFKPGLEARKDYKLEQYRALRAIINMARDYIWRIEQRLLRADDPAPIADPRDEFVRIRSTIDLPKNDANKAALVHLTQIMEGDGNRDPKAHHLILLAAISVLETPRLRFRKRRRVIAAFHKAVVATTKPGFSNSYQIGRGGQASRR